MANSLIRHFLLPLFLAGLFLGRAGSVLAATGINRQINFQGKITNTNGTNVANGDYQFVFGIYSVSSGGAAIWTETKTITVTDGVFQTNLGSVTSLPGSLDFNTDNLYLGINFNSDGEMSPRVQFTSVPQAFNAEKVSGLTVTNTTGTLTIPDSQTVDFTNIGLASGQLGIGLTSPVGKLHVSGAIPGKANTILNETGDQAVLAASVGGATKFIVTNSGSVGINTISPAAKLEIQDTAEQLRLAYDQSNYGSFTINSSGDLTVAATGNLTLADTATFSQRGVFSHGTNQGIKLPTSAGAPSAQTGQAAGDVVFDTSNQRLYVYTGSSFLQVGSNIPDGVCNSVNDCTVTLVAEYPGAVLSADGSNNAGSLTSGVEQSGNYYYPHYEFSSGQTSIQDYDVYVFWALPLGWADWDDAANAVQIDFATEDTSTSNNKIEAVVYKQGGASSYSVSASASNPAAEWESTVEGKSPLVITKTNLNSVATWAAGDVLVIKLKLYSKDNYYTRSGSIRIIYENQ